MFRVLFPVTSTLHVPRALPLSYPHATHTICLTSLPQATRTLFPLSPLPRYTYSVSPQLVGLRAELQRKRQQLQSEASHKLPLQHKLKLKVRVFSKTAILNLTRLFFHGLDQRIQPWKNDYEKTLERRILHHFNLAATLCKFR